MNRRAWCRAMLVAVPGPFALDAMAADFAQLSADELLAQSELVVQGRLIGRERVQWPGMAAALNVGVLQVETVFKGDARQKVALLELPPTRPAGLVASGDVQHPDGSHGLWYLRRMAEGLYRADHPDRYVPLAAAAARLKALRQAGR